MRAVRQALVHKAEAGLYRLLERLLDFVMKIPKPCESHLSRPSDPSPLDIVLELLGGLPRTDVENADSRNGLQETPRLSLVVDTSEIAHEGVQRT